MVSVIIPTCQAEEYLPDLLSNLSTQTLTHVEVIVVDSASTDQTVSIARAAGARVLSVSREQFDHGGTRSWAGRQSVGDIVFFLTQDVLPVCDTALETVVDMFRSPCAKPIGAVYGRQIARQHATVLARHSRVFGYPPRSRVVGLEDSAKYRIRTPFLSNAFTAYRRDAMDRIGWFKDNLISCEDTYAGAKLLLAGYSLMYGAEAAVYHSHDYTIWQEFRRYFDIGSFHRMEHWIEETFGTANDAGLQFISSGWRYLLDERAFLMMPEFVMRIGCKWCGYQLGYHHSVLPRPLQIFFSMHPEWRMRQPE